MTADHVFRERPDGLLEFVGDFDGLYANENDPWSQSGRSGMMATYYAFSRGKIVNALRVHEARGTGVEVGCGLGYALMHLEAHVPEVVWYGMDISPVALGQAKRRFPHISRRLIRADVRTISTTAYAESFDVVLLNQLLWYVLGELEQTVDRVGALLRPNGLFVVSQAFLSGQQRYGADIASGFYESRDLLSTSAGDRFSLVDQQYDDSDVRCHRDGLMVFRKTGA